MQLSPRAARGDSCTDFLVNIASRDFVAALTIAMQESTPDTVPC